MTRKSNVARGIAILFLAFVFGVVSLQPASAIEKQGRSMLGAVHNGKVIFDVDADPACPNALWAYLQTISDYSDMLSNKKVMTSFVVAIRGPSVTLATIGSDFTDMFEMLADKGVKIEVCQYAMTNFGLTQKDMLEAVNVVENTFNSLIEYQTKGYSLIPIMPPWCPQSY